MQAGDGVRALRRKPDDAECYVDDMRTTCGRHADDMRTTCGRHADDMRTTCGRRATASGSPSGRREDTYATVAFRSADQRLNDQIDVFLTDTQSGSPDGITSDESPVVRGACVHLLTCVKTACAARAKMKACACRVRSGTDMHRAVRVFTFMIRASTMPSLFAHTSNPRIITPPVAPHRNRPVDADADGDRLLSPHEIAILMVLASEPRCQQGDPPTFAVWSIAASCDWMPRRLWRLPRACRTTAAGSCRASPSAIAPAAMATPVSRPRAGRQRPRHCAERRTAHRADLHQFPVARPDLPLFSPDANGRAWRGEPIASRTDDPLRPARENEHECCDALYPRCRDVSRTDDRRRGSRQDA